MYWRLVNMPIVSKSYKYIIVLLLPISIVASQTSTCYGSTSNGKLKHGVSLPSYGKNYTSYSKIAELAGRTYVHSKVRDIIIDSYKILEKKLPQKVFKYAETGFEDGGKFKPHKTHQNGLSVDFMVPVINKNGKSVHLPTNPLNKFGYNIEFDSAGEYKDYTIDFVAMRAHLVSLHKSAIKHGYNIQRVIFDPRLQVELFKTKHGKYLKKNIKFLKKQAWVRHDEHYHVDFSIPCKRK